MHPRAAATILAFAFLTVTVIGQVVSPFATHDCSTETVYTGDIECNNDPTTCCAATGECCAGGCCPYDAVCVFAGTANEACCSLSDSTLCGSVQPQSTKTCPDPAGPSVPCSGVDSSWYCAPGCTCNDSEDEGCNCFGSGCSDGGSAESSPAAAATSTYNPSSESSSSDDAINSTPVVGVSSGTATPVTTVAGSGSSTTTSGPAAGTTTKASGGISKAQTAWVLSVGMIILGVVVIL